MSPINFLMSPLIILMISLILSYCMYFVTSWIHFHDKLNTLRDSRNLSTIHPVTRKLKL